MKRILFLWLVIGFLSQNTFGVDHPVQPPQLLQSPASWTVVKSGEFQDFSSYVRFASRKQGDNGKSICLLVYSGDETYADVCRSVQKIEALQKLLEHISPANSELEFICYKHANQKDESQQLASFIDTLARTNQSKGEVSISVIAHGENPHLVNRAAHVINPKTKIDSLIYFQPTIYETYISATGVKENSDLLSKPKGFKKLYNLYAKTGELVAYNPIYSERKFRQQAELVNHALIMRVKNVRMFKIVNKQLEDYSNQDFFSIEALKNLPILLKKIDEYYLNFDLLAIGFNHGMSPLVMINRFVSLNGSRVRAHYGIYPFENYYDVKLRLPDELMKNLAQQFSLEFKRSQEALQLISQLPVAKGYGFMKQLNTEIDDLKRRYQKVAESGMQAVEEKPEPLLPGEKQSPIQIAPQPPVRSSSLPSDQPISKQTPPPPPPPAPKLPTPAKPINRPAQGELAIGKERLKKITTELQPSQKERWMQLKENDEMRELEREFNGLTRQLIKAQFAKENKREVDQLKVDIAFIKSLLADEEE